MIGKMLLELPVTNGYNNKEIAKRFLDLAQTEESKEILSRILQAD